MASAENLASPVQQRWYGRTYDHLPKLYPALVGMAELRAAQAEADHRRVREASLG